MIRSEAGRLRGGRAVCPRALGLIESSSSRGDDPHAIAFQLDTLKHQYGCFLATFFRTGTGVMAAPAPIETACPD
jgi:hypothetical protein